MFFFFSKIDLFGLVLCHSGLNHPLDIGVTFQSAWEWDPPPPQTQWSWIMGNVGSSSWWQVLGFLTPMWNSKISIHFPCIFWSLLLAGTHGDCLAGTQYGSHRPGSRCVFFDLARFPVDLHQVTDSQEGRMLKLGYRQAREEIPRASPSRPSWLWNLRSQ